MQVAKGARDQNRLQPAGIRASCIVNPVKRQRVRNSTLRDPAADLDNNQLRRKVPKASSRQDQPSDPAGSASVPVDVRIHTLDELATTVLPVHLERLKAATQLTIVDLKRVP